MTAPTAANPLHGMLCVLRCGDYRDGEQDAAVAVAHTDRG